MQSNYAIQAVWVLKNILNTIGYPLIIVVVLGIFYRIWPGLMIVYAVAFFYFIFIVVPVTLIPVYSTIRSFITLRVGISEKGVILNVNGKEQIFLFEVIRNVHFIQDRFDRRFALGSITIELVDKNGFGYVGYDGKICVGFSKLNKNYEVVGKRGSLVHIPGLPVKSALEIKEQIIEGMKRSQLQNNVSRI
ncbi:MAG: hypothetical protein Q7S57_00340 [bacterium]|nr:hypothetical protein [bacterium]